MSYYLKIRFSQKIKKFKVSDPRLISIAQIRSCFVPPICPYLALKFGISEQCGQKIWIQSEDELLDYFLTHKFKQGSSIKMQIAEKETYDNEDHSIQIPQAISKVRSKSEEIETSLITQQFQVGYGKDFLMRSMELSTSELGEIQNFIEQKQLELLQLKNKKRQTNVKSLLDFLGKKKS